MRSSLTALLCLFGLTAAASPTPCPRNHTLSSSKGLQLRVQLRDPGRDLAAPVAGQYVSSIHDGAGTNLVGFRPDAGRLFYVNGTGPSWSTLSDGGTPPAPYGLALRALPGGGVQVARLDVGPGDLGVYVPGASGRPQLRPAGWLACSEPLAYYGGKKFNVLRHGTASGKAPPAECVRVVLLPECAELNDLPDGSLSSHEFAQEVKCYKDVSKV